MKSILFALLFCFISIITSANEVFYTLKACKGEIILLRFDSVSGFIPPLKYAILGDTFQSNPNFILPAEGIYNFIVIDTFGQQFLKSIEVLISPEINIQAEAKNGNCNTDGEISWQINGGIPPIITTLNNETISSNGNQSFPAGVYTFRVEDSQLCSRERRIRIESQCIEPYTAFSPNGDGLNDLWEIKYIEFYPDAWVEVFDRYGRTVFKSQGAYSPWDGKLNGTNLPSGNYYFTILPEGRTKTEGIINGSLVILR